MTNDEKLNKFMRNWDSYWGRGEVAHTEFIRHIVSSYLEAGIEYVDKPASVQNVVAFLNVASKAYWTKPIDLSEAADNWNTALDSITQDPKNDISELMCLVYTVMRGGSVTAMSAIRKITRKSWRPDITVWDLMCEVPIFF